MATKIYLPTKADQEETNAKIDALAQKVAELQSAQATPTATVVVRFNWEGQTFEVPSDAATKTALLTGAKVIVRIPGGEDYTQPLTALTGFAAAFTVRLTGAALTEPATVFVRLGSTAYATTGTRVDLSIGGSATVHVNSKQASGETVEVFRAQPYSDNPSASSDARIKAGSSYLGVKITTGGTAKTLFGHWDAGQKTWIDESLTEVALWDFADGETPTKRVISDIVTDGWVPIEERLDCLKNMKCGTLSYTDGKVTVGENKIMRYDPVWMKTTKEEVNMPIEQSDGTLKENKVVCIVKWYANSQVDENYHLLPLFEQYVRQSDGTFAATACAHGYIARYPIGNLAQVTIDGAKVNAPQWKAGNGKQYVPGTRNDCLTIARRLNKLTATLSFEGEEAATIAPDETNRTWGIAGTAEIGFLQNMAYLYFGVNVQGAANNNDFSKNIFPGICTDKVQATTNGATDFILAAGKFTGAVNTAATTNSISFLGVEDGLWSSTGWYIEDVTSFARRKAVSDADGKVTLTYEGGFLYATDMADVEPGASRIENETYALADDAKSYEAKLKAKGYREASFPAFTSEGPFYRVNSAAGGAYLPCKSSAAEDLCVGTCDYTWGAGSSGSYPCTDFAFATTKAYAVGDYVVQGGSLYKCTAAHAAGAWNAEHFTVQKSATVTRRSYYLAALGANRYHGSGLGLFCVYARYGLTIADGYAWRARPFLHKVS